MTSSATPSSAATGGTSPSTSERAQNYCHWILSGVLAVVFIAALLQPQNHETLDVALLFLALVINITSLSRQMPLQNVLLGMGITALIGSLAHTLSSLQGWGIPFGPVFFNEACGAKILNGVPWPIPLLWIVALFSSRGTARVILRPWRKLKNYGYWLIGLTAVLVLAFDVGLEPFAAGANHFWAWRPTKIPVNWYGASPLDFISWALVSVLILAFATPALIKKKPGSRSPLDLNPLGIWLAAVVLFGVTCAQAALWPAVAVDAAMVLVILGVAIPGARW